MTTLYIPPPNIKVRLRQLSTKIYLTATRDANNNGTIMTEPVAQPSGDSWFTLAPGTGQFSGKYSLFSVHNDQDVIFKEMTMTIGGTHIKFDVATLQDHSDQKPTEAWFQIAGNPDATQFQIIYPGNQSPLGVHTDRTPRAWFDAPGSTADNQWFVFEYEDMVLDHIDYKLDAAQLIDVAPTILAHQTAVNDLTDGSPQTMSVTLSASVTEQTSFTLSVGASVTASAEVTEGVPGVASGKIGMSATVTTNFTYGETKSTTRTVSQTVNVTVQPGHTVVCSLTGKQGTLNVPFNAIYRAKDSGQTMAIPGIYNGVAVYDTEAHWS